MDDMKKVYDAFLRAHAAGDTKNASVLANYIREQQAGPPEITYTSPEAIPTKQKEGFLPSLKEGAVGAYEATKRGITAPFESDEAIRADYAKQVEEAQARNVGYTPFSAIPEAYEKEGLGAAAATTYKAARDALGRSLPYSAPTMAGAFTGARAGMAAAPFLGPLAPAAPIVGGIVGGIAGGTPMFMGTNVERRIDEKTPGPLVDQNLVGTSVGQATLDTAANMLTLGTGIISKVLKRPVGKVTETQLETIANRSLTGTVGRGAARGVASEMPTEVAQQILERKQAGLDLTSEDAYREYGEAAAAAGVLGGAFGGVGNIVTRGQARDKTAQLEQQRQDELDAITRERQRIAGIAATAAREEQTRLAAEEAALKEREAELRKPLTKQMELELSPETTVEEVAAKRAAASPQGDLFIEPAATPAIETATPTLDEPTIKSFGFKKNSLPYKAMQSLENPEMSLDEKMKRFDLIIEKNQDKIKTTEQAEAIDTFKRFMSEQKAKEAQDELARVGTDTGTSGVGLRTDGERGRTGATPVTEESVTPPVDSTGADVGVPIGGTEQQYATLEQPAQEAQVPQATEIIQPPRMSAEERQQRLIEQRAEEEAARKAERAANAAAAKAEQAGFRAPSELLPAEREGLQAAREFEEGVEDVDMSIGRRMTSEEDLADQAIRRVMEREKLGYDIWTGDTAKGERVSNTIKRLVNQFDQGKLNPDQLADQLGNLHDRMRRASLERKYAGRERVRGADFIRQRLLEAKRRGDISEEASDLAEWFINKNPALVEDLGISIRDSERSAAGPMASGYYNEAGRIATLIKGSSSDTTAVHEILHHLEKMMPADVQLAIRKEWLNQAVKARAQETNPEWVKYFDHVMANQRSDAMAIIEKLGDPTEQYYKFLNPSEFWAVHATDIMHNRFKVGKSMAAKIKNWLKEFIEKAKATFGLDSSAPMIRALNDLLADKAPEVRSKQMLGRQKPDELSASISGSEITGQDIFRDIVSQRVTKARTDLGAKLKALAPKLLSMYQLVDQFGKDMPGLVDYAELNDRMTMTQQRLKNKSHEVLSDWGQFANRNGKANEKLSKLMMDATRTRIHPDEEFESEANAHLTDDMKEKYEELSNTYESLPEEAKSLYQRSRALLQENFELRRTVYNDMVKQSFAEELQDATPEQAENINARIQKAIQEHELLINEMRGPYFPLMRFGEFLVVAESPELRALRDQLKDATGDERKKLAGRVTQMEQQDEHYQVHAAEKASERGQIANELRAKGMKVRETKSEEYMNNLRASTFASIDQLEKIFDKEADVQLDKEEMKKLRLAMIETVLAGLPENSALQRQIRRRNIAGAEKNMMRAFAEATERDSFYISRLGFMKPLSRSLINMNEQSSNEDLDTSTRDQLRDVYNNVRSRLNMDVKYDYHPWLSKLTGASSIYHLGIAPSYLLTNMTQPFAITMPQLAGEYGGMKASRAIMSGWKQAYNAVKGGRNGEFFNLKDTDLSKVFTGETLKMVQNLQDLGKLDIANNMDTEVYTKGMSPKTIKFWKMFNWASHNIELMNRLSTALAAFKLEKDRSGSFDAAMNKAREAVELTQLDYSDTNAAYFMKQGHFGGLNRVPMQFRKYQQGMIYLLARNFKNAWGGDKAARKAFLYLMGTQLVMAGVRGIPVAAPLLFLLGAFGDEDDPEGDLETQLRNGLADTFGPDVARVFWKGLPAMMGVDSGSMSMENLLLPFPMMRASAITDAATGKDAVTEFMFNLGGAPVSMASKMFDSWLLMSEGDYQKGLEKLAPKFISSLIKAERLGSEGLTTKAGNVAIEADEFNAWDQTLKALGFSPTLESEYYQAMYEKERISDAIDNRRNKIIKAIATARLAGEDTSELLEERRQFNAEHPTRRITGDSIRRSVAQRKKDKRERSESGVRFTKRERDIKDVTRFAE